MRKKLISVFLCITMIVGLVAHSGDGNILLADAAATTTDNLENQEYVGDFNLYKYRADVYLRNDTSCNYDIRHLLGSEMPSKSIVNLLDSNKNFQKAAKEWRKIHFLTSPSGDIKRQMDEKGYYTAIILSIFKAESQNADYIMDSAKQISASANKIASNMKNWVEASHELDIAELNMKQSIKSLSASDRTKITNQMEKAFKSEYSVLLDGSDALGVISDIFDAVNTIEEAVMLMESYAYISQMSDDMKSVLIALYNICPDDRKTLKEALYEAAISTADFSSAVKQAVMNASDKVLTDVMTTCIDECWSVLLSCNPYSAAFMISAGVGTFIGDAIANTLFSNDKTIEQYEKMKCLNEVASLIKIVISNMGNTYLNNKTTENASNYFASIDAYFSAAELSCKFALDYSDILYNDAALGWLAANDATYDEYKRLVEEISGYLKRSEKDLITNYLIELEKDYPEIYRILIENEKNSNIMSGAYTYNGHSYYVFRGSGTWEDAKEYCEALGGYLAVISDENENIAVYNIMKAAGYNSAYFGYSCSDGIWKWVDGEESDYENWNTGEPNNEFGKEKYAMFYYKCAEYKWNDGAYGEPVFICEWPEIRQEYDNKYEYNGHRYYVYSDICDTWEEAKEYCEALGGYLAVINDSEENYAVYNIMKKLGYSDAYFGYSIQDGEWKWVNNEQSNYVNWSKGEPSNDYGGEKYGMFYHKCPLQQWNDGGFGVCTDNGGKAFICEWDNEEENAFSYVKCADISTEGNYIEVTGYGGNDKELVIPDNIDGNVAAAIGNEAFKNNASLNRVVMPECIESIGQAAFYGCKELTDVVFPNSLKKIEDYSFEGCSSLKNVVIPKNVTEIGNQALGYYWIDKPYADFTISGYAGTAAETYAKENGFKFIELKNTESSEGVQIEYPKQDIAEGGNITLVTDKLSKEDNGYQNIEVNIKDKIVSEGIKPENVKFTAFDITLKDDKGTVVQPSGKVTVKIPLPEGYTGEKCKVYYVNDKGEFVDMAAAYVGGYMIFETDHFSTYMITETELKAEVEGKVIFADANSDGTVNSKDVVMMKKHLAGIKVDINLAACDVNADGKFDSKDVVKTMKKLAGYDVVLGEK